MSEKSKAATSSTRGLSQSQKAAAILVAMGKPAAGRLLKFFKQEELKALLEAARKLRTIPQNELEKIVAEFETEFAEGAGLLDSGDQNGHHPQTNRCHRKNSMRWSAATGPAASRSRHRSGPSSRSWSRLSSPACWPRSIPSRSPM